jgi:DNA gyrase inhibitor GyrI
MSILNVRIVKLEPMRVASAHAYSANPESDAWNKLIAWAREKGFTDDLETHRIYGFNNPNPSHGSPNYGYEFWIVVEPEVQGKGEIKIKNFEGGLYAVTRCTRLKEIGRDWQKLVTWREGSKYRPAHHQWLEKRLGGVDETEDTLTLDLYLPISE